MATVATGLTHLPGSAAAAAGPGGAGGPGGRLGGGGALGWRPPRRSAAAGALGPGKAWRRRRLAAALLPALTTILLVQEMTWKTEERLGADADPQFRGPEPGLSSRASHPPREKTPGSFGGPAPAPRRLEGSGVGGNLVPSNLKRTGRLYKPARGEIEKKNNNEKEKVKRTLELGHFFLFLVGIKSSRILNLEGAPGSPNSVAAPCGTKRGVLIFLTLSWLHARNWPPPNPV